MRNYLLATRYLSLVAFAACADPSVEQSDANVQTAEAVATSPVDTGSGSGGLGSGSDAGSGSDDDDTSSVAIGVTEPPPADAVTCTTEGMMAGMCNAPPVVCDDKPKEFSASMVLASKKHHTGVTQHIHNGPFGDDVGKCSDGDCAGFFRHGRTSSVRWNAKCVKSGDTCVAKVELVTDFLVSSSNTAGANYHWHFIEPQYSCAFIDNGNGPKMTGDCNVNGAEDIKLHAAVTKWGDGVDYGTGYAANHDNSSAPSVGVSVGAGPVGAFVILNNAKNATYTRGQAWTQGMACDADGEPYLLSDDGAGHNYPQLGSATGNE